jgi:hypothetical protein
MTIHTCPRCELRFERENEVADHLVVDHRLDPDAVRAHPVPVPADDVRRHVVVVGNHTLLTDALRDRLLELVAEAPTALHVVAPVHTDDEVALGYWRGRTLAERLEHAVTSVTVDVGIGDPVALVQRSARALHVDRVVLSTLPPGLSRWLDVDLAGRIRHVLDVPVEVVTAEGAPARSTSS